MMNFCGFIHCHNETVSLLSSRAGSPNARFTYSCISQCKSFEINHADPLSCCPAGILGLLVNADGSLALTLQLDCFYVLKADAKVLVQGTILGQPVNLVLRAGPIEDGGLVSCVAHTLTTAVPVVGCLLSQLLPTVNLDVPLNLVLGSDNTGCSGLLPGLGGQCALLTSSTSSIYLQPAAVALIRLHGCAFVVRLHANCMETQFRFP